jgi:hypothetical protein
MPRNSKDGNFLNLQTKFLFPTVWNPKLTTDIYMDKGLPLDYGSDNYIKSRQIHPPVA